MKTLAALLCLLLASTTSSRASEPATPKTTEASPEVIRLDPVTISDSPDLPPPENWLYTQTDGFEILSNASKSTTSSILKDFHKYRQALRLICPPPPNQPPASSSIILSGAKGKFTDFTHDGKRDYTGAISLFLQDAEQTTIVIDLETTTLNLADLALTPGSTPNREFRVDPYRQLYREYIRSLLSQNNPPLQPWLLEGLCQIIMNVEVYGKWINYGKLDNDARAVSSASERKSLKNFFSTASTETNPTAFDLPSADNETESFDTPSTSETDGSTIVNSYSFTNALANRKLIPLDQFLSLTSSSPETQNSLGNNLWSKQAYAFVHFCMFSRDAKYRLACKTLTQRLNAEPLSEKLFIDCFGVSYQAFTEELSNYISNPLYHYASINLTKAGRITAPNLELREATEGEVCRIKGDAQRLAGLEKAARNTYRAAYIRGERNLHLIGSLGIEEHRAGHTERARELLETAAVGTTRPSVLLALARLRHAESLASPSAPNGKLSEPQMASILEPLFAARALKPAHPSTYELIAQIWMQGSILPKPHNLAVLGEGVQLFPSNGNLAAMTARLYQKIGDIPNATAVAKLGLRFATTAAGRTRFESFLAALPPSTPP